MARWERMEAITNLGTNYVRYVDFPPNIMSPSIAQNYEMFTGMSTSVPPTPIYVTNTLYNIECFEPYVESGYTNIPHVTRAIVVNLDDYGYEENGDLIFPMTEGYLEHWRAGTDGLFTVWFSDGKLNTGSADLDYDDNPLPVIMSPGAILSYTNVGRVDGIETNNYGQIVNSAWGFTRTPPITQNWNVAEIVYAYTNNMGTNSAAWLFREQAQADYASFTAYPNLIYTAGGTGAFVSVALTITGTVFGVWSPDEPPAYSPQPEFYQTTSNAVTTINVTSTNRLALSHMWKRVTNITSTNTPNVADTWSIVYDGLFPIYGDMSYTLTATDLNERRSVIDALRWSYDVGTGGLTADGTTNRWQWTGTSTSSWAAAKSACAASTPTGAGNALVWRWTSGTYDGTTWTANAEAARCKRSVFGPSMRGDNQASYMSTEYEKVIDLYAKASTAQVISGIHTFTNGTHEFDAFADEVWLPNTNQYHGIAAVYTGYGGTNTLVGTPYTDAGWIGTTNFPDTWCVEPTVGSPSTRGFQIGNPLAVIKYDSTTNGFQFIRD